MSEQQIPVHTEDAILNAIGVLAYLRSIARSCGALSAEEEEVVEQTIERLSVNHAKLHELFDILLRKASADDIATFHAMAGRSS